MTGDRDPEKGILCPCGNYMPFENYVYAHWTYELTTTCAQCGRRFTVREGQVESVSDPDETFNPAER